MALIPLDFFARSRGGHSGARALTREPANLEIPRCAIAHLRSGVAHDPGMTVHYRRTAHIRIRPATAEPMPTARRMLSGVASALFMARRIQAGLAANNNPSSTNRIPTPMRKSANAMDLIGLQPPVLIFFDFWAARIEFRLRPC